ncbi:SMP-30/gluconolactonase/LRE family protein [Pseudozobellia thermophila]|uniref:Sugar lactone lactonase YvrE n=1 Tax=Pseudozobellia thermophila TaxID=192903 RepID=A0A1M6BFS4_9FLAO|nr:SMP-30/gluconolactonase/LRE family protein [Pseudozobellia thermophila]SHI47604.1 Sugar lactone lactonase YvrE [Pseudozobellia thermophila]
MPETSTHKAEPILDNRSLLGEGPVWDERSQTLYWVDIEGKKLHAHRPATQHNAHWDFDEMLGAAVPMENGNLLLALEKGLAVFDVDTGFLHRPGVLENNDPMMRFNDGKTGPNGHFYIGTMHKEFAPKSGTLFRVDPTLKVKTEISGTTISNGMAWTSDRKTFYFSDTDTYKIDRYEYHLETGSLSNRQTAFKIPSTYGGADGMCIDSENMLWIAHWGGSCVRRWNPKTGEVLQKIDVDAPHVTSCCFGGKDLDTLYITTARSGLSQKQIEKHPKSGGLFAYRPKVKGRPITYFKHS